MKLVKFEIGAKNGEGFLEGETIHLAGLWRSGPARDAPFFLSQANREELVALLRGSMERVALADVQLAAPIDPRAKIICVGLNYLSHNEEAKADLPLQPALFLKDRSTLSHPGEALQYPHASDTFDYEGELAVVIGRQTREVDRAEAAVSVGAYCCFMDGSVREFQHHSISAGKNFWRSSSLGPCLTTADDIPDINAVQLRTFINGEERQLTSVSKMIYDIPAIIAYCSLWTTLEPGDVIATGTPAGVGGGFKPPKWLRPNDKVDVVIEGIGVLSNIVSQAHSEGS